MRHAHQALDSLAIRRDRQPWLRHAGASSSASAAAGRGGHRRRVAPRAQRVMRRRRRLTTSHAASPRSDFRRAALSSLPILRISSLCPSASTVRLDRTTPRIRLRRTRRQCPERTVGQRRVRISSARDTMNESRMQQSTTSGLRSLPTVPLPQEKLRIWKRAAAREGRRFQYGSWRPAKRGAARRNPAPPCPAEKRRVSALRRMGLLPWSGGHPPGHQGPATDGSGEAEARSFPATATEIRSPGPPTVRPAARYEIPRCRCNRNCLATVSGSVGSSSRHRRSFSSAR